MHVKYDTKGICAVRVEFDVEDGVVKNISFLGGCDGNHKGIAALAEGMTPEEAARRLNITHQTFIRWTNTPNG